MFARASRPCHRNGDKAAPLPTMIKNVRHVLTRFGVYTSHPAAFLIVLLYAVLWATIAPDKLDWHGFATLATWLMTLVIQRAEYRDTEAIQAKLDELLHVHGRARNSLTRMDEEEPEDIRRHRQEARERD